MNVSGDMGLNRSPNKPVNGAVPTDPSQFTKALQNAATYLQTVVPAAHEAGQMALAKKKEKDSVYRVGEVAEMAPDEEQESVHQIVQKIAARVRTIAELERKTLGL